LTRLDLTYSWSMEFDIVELGNVNGRLRLSMEFDIVDTDLR